MANRRQFLAGLMATGLAPVPSWATVGAPAFLAAAARPDGSFVLCGISTDHDVLFRIPLPARGHAAAAHPTRPEAVAFARRPGTFAVVIDCTTGKSTATLTAPEGRHFYGHGVFSADGNTLYTTENDFEAGTGRIGIWDTNTYARIGEIDSGGVGPHDLKRLPGTDTLVVANGGIDTHPDSGRTKLNIPTMQPNLTYIADERIIETVTLPPEQHKNSIRHLAVTQSGAVAFGTQWQGDNPAPALVGFHTLGSQITLLSTPADELRQMDNYVGSIAFTPDAQHIVVTSPRGGIVQRYATDTMSWVDSVTQTDASGAATTKTGVLISTGTGHLVDLSGAPKATHTQDLRWDNHLVSL